IVSNDNLSSSTSSSSSARMRRSSSPIRSVLSKPRLPDRRRAMDHSGTRYFAFLVGLYDVTLLEILEVRKTDAAFEALLDFTSILLEPSQRCDLAVPDDDAITQEADFG